MIRNIVNWQSLDERQQSELLQRPTQGRDSELLTTVAQILARVRSEGDTAVAALTHRFDGVQLSDFRVTEQEIDAAEHDLADDAISAIDAAIANVRCFHEAQFPASIDMETMPGVRCERVPRAIEAVGLYVPAGSAPLPSAAIMLAVPASIAGCRRRVLCTPPRPDGTVDPAVLVAARRSGANEIFKIGGAQAIAAMAYGTRQVSRVDKIFGPGNAWVTAAKSQVAADPSGAAIDMPAGPSEVLVIADANANADFVAADLLSQAEHGPDSQVMLVTCDASVASRVVDALEGQLKSLSRRSVATRALQGSRFIVTGDLASAFEISNAYAPEHLILHMENPRQSLAAIRNAGSVFLGPWAPESVGDYCSGTNHVLPTYGAASSHSGLGVEQFMRQMTVQELTEEGLRRLAPIAVALATLEGLDAHAAAVNIRLSGSTPT